MSRLELASGVVAQFLTTGGSPLTDPVYAGIWTLVPLFTVSYGLGGLYPGFGVSAIQLIRTLSRQTSLVFVVIAGSAYAMPPAGDPPVRMFVLWWTASLACVPLMRVQVSSVAVAGNSSGAPS